MSATRSDGPGCDVDKHGGLFTPRTSVHPSRFATRGSSSPYTPPSTKSVDIQTDVYSSSRSHVASSMQVISSLPPPVSSLNVQQRQQIAEYIENEMKEKYMEQSRTLEQLQLQMRQELLDKQAQLMEQLHRLDSQPTMSNGNADSVSLLSSSVNGSRLDQRSPVGEVPTSSSTPSAVVAAQYSSPASHTMLTKAISTNTHSPFHNGVNGYTSNNGDRRASNVMTSSFSADESVNGSTSQGSSHDTWDSTNAFTHERPVLTGSERSTPTPSATPPVLPGVVSSSDLELLSQSIHIPVDVKCADDGGSPPHSDRQLHNSTADILRTELKLSSNAGSKNEVAGADLIDLSSHLSDLAGDDNTPRNAASKSDTENMVSVGTTQSVRVDVRLQQSSSSVEEDCDAVYRRNAINSASSTPPPESPADELSASLRFSLRQKHSRHLADMKSYYENELTDLKDKLTSSFDISKHAAYQSSEIENKKLREKCRILEEELLRANRYINSVDKQMDDLESSFTATLAASSRTQAGQLDSSSSPSHIDEQICKNKLVQAELYISSLETKNKDLFSALCDAYEVRDNTAHAASRGNKLYDESQERYKELKASNDNTLSKLQSTEASLDESRKDMDSLKRAVQRLEVEHQKLAKENDLLRLTTSTPLRDSSFTKSQSSADERVMSPMLKAERQLEKSMNNGSPSKYRSRHHQYHSDSARQHSRQHANNQHESSSVNRTSKTTDLNSKQLSPQPLSDATQSSDNSTKERSTKYRHKSSSRKSGHRTSVEQCTTSAQLFGKDDLVSAYSPIVDRQRHSSSASSSGHAAKSTASPSKQSIDRPYGFHHVGASVSPSKRTQQWAVLSPFNRIADREKNSPAGTGPTSTAMKNLNFSLNNNSPTTSPQKSKINKDEILDKVRTGVVFSEDPEQLSGSTRKASSVYHDKLQLIKDAETRLDELLVEKRQLESSLTRMSTTHCRKDKQKQETIEQQLDRVDKDLGSVRMTLRRYNVL